MNYITTVEAAEKWNITASRVLKLAQAGRIVGAKQIGSRWMIPDSAEKPVDARKRASKTQETDTFRFPSFEYRDISAFTPPLNDEELQLKASHEAFHACRFEEADRLLGDLPEKAKDRYCRICAFYVGCMVDIFLCNPKRFAERYAKLCAELQEDFPHKEEMMQYIYKLDASLGNDSYYTKRFHVVPGYAYHESFLPHLAMLCAVTLSMPEEKHTLAELNNAEMNCILLKNSNDYADLQYMHMSLCTAYCMLGMQKESIAHFQYALRIAEKYSLYCNLVGPYYYIQKSLKSAFADFPEGLEHKISKIAEDMHQRYVRFMDAISKNSLYIMLLNNREYIFLYYAMQGLTNKEIAHRMRVSVGTVGKQYGNIYTLLGVKNKRELINLCQQSVNETFLK